MTRSITTYLTHRREDFGEYLRSELGDFHISSAHRWLVYAMSFIMVGLFTFICLDLYSRSDLLLDIKLAFKGMYAWHTAINFSICLAVMDSMVGWLLRPWGSFERRTVGKTWVILLATYVLAFISQRTIVYEAVVLYAPELIWKHEMDPPMRPGVVPQFLFMLPFWGIICYGIIRVMLSKQAQAQELFRVRIDTILEERQYQKRVAPSPKPRSTDRPMADADNCLPLPADADVPPIRIHHVGHVTVEDHYLRIYFQSDDGLKNTLIRMPLKELIARLPAHQFLQVHRSHVINLAQVAGLKRSGRNMRVATKHGDFELPVSRYRVPSILPKLEAYLHPSDQ